MKEKFFCFGKNGFCDQSNDDVDRCRKCKHYDGSGGDLRMQEKLPRLDRSAWEPCEHCKPSKNPLDRWGPHQFPIDGNEIYCYDTDDGWEGEEINFCPWCSRPLTDAAWDMLERRLAGREHQ